MMVNGLMERDRVSGFYITQMDQFTRVYGKRTVGMELDV